ncbi:MAG: hypothetical protein HUU50_22195 [Candidatus Brocadiae bacterium]|nr:hypothetical protein [Candidatus Brocadiia bacterium]
MEAKIGFPEVTYQNILSLGKMLQFNTSQAYPSKYKNETCILNDSYFGTRIPSLYIQKISHSQNEECHPCLSLEEEIEKEKNIEKIKSVISIFFPSCEVKVSICENEYREYYDFCIVLCHKLTPKELASVWMKIHKELSQQENLKNFEYSIRYQHES